MKKNRLELRKLICEKDEKNKNWLTEA